ncbi:DUF3857 domain-containing protein [Mucilaginibacter sp. CAU 1740]|uniref:DUF3857 domain-containing protein n=1 Tax=Mucilaginibacter sp. CAU 1740 TaxID=3140365 RepID=UPI00325B385C
MNRLLTLAGVALFTLSAQAQTAAPKPVVFGKVDVADLEMTKCDFEPDANAEVLFNKGDVYYDGSFDIIGEYHKRIKIFNDNAKDEANIRIEYIGGNRLEYITGVEAQTINLVNGKPEITKLDKKLIYTQAIDRVRSVIVFSMPNVKAGSVIEYKYKYHTVSISNFPSWDFQQKIPVKYSELDTSIPDLLYFREVNHVWMPYSKSIHKSEARTMPGNSSLSYNEEKDTRVIENIPSLRDEPFMRSYADNTISLQFNLTSVKSNYGFYKSYSDTWAKVGGIIADDEDFGGQLKRKLKDEEPIIAKAKTFKTDEEKIAYIFNAVKNTMKWDGVDRWYTNDGTYRAWEKKTGNSAEVNIILYHLLKQSGIKEIYPMIVSTREHGKVNRYNTSLSQFNRAVVYIPVDTTKEYILDATSKYNMYNETPDNLLNSLGLYIDKPANTYDMLFIKKEQPARQVTIINAEIMADGKMTGTADISSFSYHKINSCERYKTDGEKKYIDYLRDNDNNLKITSLKMNDMESDTLPLVQNIAFNLELTGSDGNYIYVNPNLFTPIKVNPFINEKRSTDIDFGHRNRYEIAGTYKIPAGYKVDALPKSIRMVIPDQSISFRRVMAEQNGVIVVRYVITYEKTFYEKENYPELHEFYKQMQDMINEQIVLKKA